MALQNLRHLDESGEDYDVKLSEILDLFALIDKNTENLEKIYHLEEPLTKYILKDFLTHTKNTFDAYKGLYKTPYWKLYLIWAEYVIKYGSLENYKLITKTIFHCDRNHPDYLSDLLLCAQYGSVGKFVHALKGFLTGPYLNEPEEVNYSEIEEALKNNPNCEEMKKIIFEAVDLSPSSVYMFKGFPNSESIEQMINNHEEGYEKERKALSSYFKKIGHTYL